MIEKITASPSETEEFAADLAKSLEKPTTIALFGGLGMGKTTFVRGFVGALASCDDVSSPTFAIVNEYRANCPIYHFDMYRISSIDDLESVGFFDYLDAESYIIIEWSENIVDFLPSSYTKVEFIQIDINTRKILVSEVENQC